MSAVVRGCAPATASRDVVDAFCRQRRRRRRDRRNIFLSATTIYVGDVARDADDAARLRAAALASRVVVVDGPLCRAHDGDAAAAADRVNRDAFSPPPTMSTNETNRHYYCWPLRRPRCRVVDGLVAPVASNATTTMTTMTLSRCRHDASLCASFSLLCAPSSRLCTPSSAASAPPLASLCAAPL